VTPRGKIKRTPASTLAKWVSVSCEMISEKKVEQSFNKYCIKNELQGTYDDISWDNFGLGYPDLLY
jgi:hypothetical protein